MEKIQNEEKVRRARFFSIITLLLGISMILFGLFFQTGFWIGMGTSSLVGELVHIVILRD